ncbi:MAG: putative DNA binding domain-containing protein [Spirochaetales bacterium]|nr:putative DNA binding domain-containing protein [Spirochaetales bacterium]
MIDHNDHIYISSYEAAEVMEKTPRYVTHLCQQGRIDGAVKDGKDWKIPKASLETIHLEKRGRKPSLPDPDTGSADILAEIRRGECETVEFKEDVPEHKEKYLKTAVAFANGNGGSLVFGVKDRTWEIIGLPPDEIFQKMDSIANSIYDATEPRIIPYIDVFTLEDKQIIVVTVNACSQKPCHLRREGFINGTYIRVAGTTRKADPSIVRELELEGSNRGFDTLRAPGTITEKEINRLCDRMYRHALEWCLTDQKKKEQRKVTINQLLSWNIIQESDGQFFPTNAWYLLTGKLTEYPFARIQCAVFKGTDRCVFVTRKDIEGPIDQQIEDAMIFVMEHLNEGSRVDGPYRKDYYELPLDSIREMISNAVCHRSYLKNSCVQVAIYDDRIEVSSPGGLCENLTIEKIVKGQSRVRNRAIAAAFHYMHLIENWGTGIPKILRESRQYGLKDPEINDSGSDFRISLFRREFDFDRYGVVDPRERGNKVSNDNRNDNGNGTLNDTINETINDTLNATESKVLKIVSTDRNASITSIMGATGLSRSTVIRNLQSLVESGKIVRDGSRKNGRWRIV